MSERKKHFVIGKRIAVIIGALFAVAAASLVVAANQWMKKDALEEARIQARIILDRNLAIHAYFNKQLKPELLIDLKEKIEKGYFEPSWMSSTYAIREINKFSKTFSQYDYYYKECAINARSPENEADKYKRAFIERLNADHPLPRGLPERLNVKCSLEAALFPKTGKPWQFGIRNCAGTRRWSKKEVKLFNEIALRLENALISMLFLGDLQGSTEKLHSLNSELELRVAERTAELEAKNAELEKINRLFVGREKKMAELKKKIKTLENRCREEGSSR